MTVVASGDRPTALTADGVLPTLRTFAGQLGIKGSSRTRHS